MTYTAKFCGVLLVLLALLAFTASRYQSKYQETLQTLEREQAITRSQEKALVEIRRAEIINRELTAKQLNQEQILRQKGYDENKKLRQTLATDNCNDRQLPDSVIDILHRREKPDANPVPAATGATVNKVRKLTF